MAHTHTTTAPGEIDRETLQLMAISAHMCAQRGGRESFEAYLRQQPEWERLGAEQQRRVALILDKMAGVVARKGADAPAYVAHLADRAGLNLSRMEIDGGLH